MSSLVHKTRLDFYCLKHFAQCVVRLGDNPWRAQHFTSNRADVLQMVLPFSVGLTRSKGHDDNNDINSIIII
ncbi:hypothetical protein SERLA73DRAFT_173642 [Serpula lacrymans var. lacrymans S7.3]|uniref:Uncharacterized protein n=1 Tax=Serpula lacrymans var. lacrymans (strain S7.3) TaxID=936435 RepID=F8PF95_SERL3|nr:hypothetical protein SERLA73DRAFT_173642 [Serpula lacrymans var. lacrymans S7.3]